MFDAGWAASGIDGSASVTTFGILRGILASPVISGSSSLIARLPRRGWMKQDPRWSHGEPIAWAGKPSKASKKRRNKAIPARMAESSPLSRSTQRSHSCRNGRPDRKVDVRIARTRPSSPSSRQKLRERGHWAGASSGSGTRKSGRSGRIVNPGHRRLPSPIHSDDGGRESGPARTSARLSSVTPPDPTIVRLERLTDAPAIPVSCTHPTGWPARRRRPPRRSS